MKEKIMTPAQTKFYKELIESGFTVVNQVEKMWFEAIDPMGYNCLVVKQNAHAYHWFDKNTGSTASGSSAKSCYMNCIGDAIGSDSELKTYYKLILSASEKLMNKYEGLMQAAMQVDYELQSN